MGKEYFKDFDKWNKYQKILNNKKFNGFCNEREIWWCALGVNIGSEQDGKNNLFERPVLIIRKFGNGLVWVLPTTSKKHTGSYFIALDDDNHLNSSIILLQLRVVSLQRLRRFVRKISTYEFAIIQGRVIDLFKYR